MAKPHLTESNQSVSYSCSFLLWLETVSSQRAPPSTSSCCHLKGHMFPRNPNKRKGKDKGKHSGKDKGGNFGPESGWEEVTQRSVPGLVRHSARALFLKGAFTSGRLPHQSSHVTFKKGFDVEPFRWCGTPISWRLSRWSYRTRPHWWRDPIKLQGCGLEALETGNSNSRQNNLQP